MLDRARYIEQIHQQFEVHSICGILGPRQAGKTTLAQQYAKNQTEPVHFFDLENPSDWESLQQPMLALERLEGLVIIDEVQYLPSLFPVLRVLCDKRQARYLVLGSASPLLIKNSSESLAGRIGYIEMMPFHIGEVMASDQLLVRGGFPRSYLASSDKASITWRRAFIQNFLERDIPALGISIPSKQLRRFWMMLCHVHGQQLNVHQLGTAMGVSGHTIRKYLDILQGTFMIRQLQPWHENISKRQVKMPKLYFRDTGLLLALLGVGHYEALIRHPQIGAIWEGFAIEQLLMGLAIQQEEAFYWRTAQGAELDLLIVIDGRRIGVELKFSDAPTITQSMRISLLDLKLHHLYVVYPGARQYALSSLITVVPLSMVLDVIM